MKMDEGGRHGAGQDSPGPGEMLLAGWKRQGYAGTGRFMRQGNSLGIVLVLCNHFIASGSVGSLCADLICWATDLSLAFNVLPGIAT